MSIAEEETAEDAIFPVERTVLELLVCPLTKKPLIYDSAAQELISATARLAFPIRNGVPLMCEDAARPLTDDDLKRRSRGAD